ncbi:MAG: DNA recombination protein RmuC [Rickettsiales bacterium]|jgi:DNA recombination protein RmuC|nr:DNA recombination protein RmuC [Rickettsiales bacterium]
MFTALVIFALIIVLAATRFYLVKSYEKQISSLAKKHEEQIKYLENSSRELEIKIGVLSGEKQQLVLQVTELSNRLAEESRLLTDCERKNKYLDAKLEEKEKNLEEISALKEQMISQLVNQFQVISNEVVEKQKDVFYREQKSGLSNIIEPLKTQIDNFNRKIQENSQIAQASKISIDEQIKTLVRHTGDIGTRADSLANVLRGDRKMQGNWGELRLKNLLESIGLVAGEDYIEQRCVKDKDDRRFIMDFVIKLPNDRELIIDSKVSLSNYEKYMQETNEHEKNKFMQKYCEDIKNHIDELGSKKYHELCGCGSLDFVFMFLPLESAYLEAISYDASLFTRAFKNGVALVSGSSLVPVLRMVEHLWSVEKQNKNIKEIVKLSGRMCEKIKKLLESVQKLGNDLDGIKKSYGNIVSYMSEGKGNVLKTANDIKMLAGKDRTMEEIEFDGGNDYEDTMEEISFPKVLE